MLCFPSGVLEAFGEYFPLPILAHLVHLAPESLVTREIDGAAANEPVAPALFLSETMLLSAKQ